MSTINPVNTAPVEIFEGPAAPTRVQAIVSKIQTIWFNFVETMKSLFESIRNLPANTKARYNAWLETQAVAQEEARFQAMMKDKKAFEFNRRQEIAPLFEGMGMWALAESEGKVQTKLVEKQAQVKAIRKANFNVVSTAAKAKAARIAKAEARIAAAQFGVNRIANRQAASRLENRGFIARLFARVA